MLSPTAILQVSTAFALGSWIAFKSVTDGALAMGDLVLLDREVAPVMSRLQQGGIEQTAVHHHLLRESPRIVYMHVHAHGDAVKIAEKIKAALALTGTPATMPAPPAINFQPTSGKRAAITGDFVPIASEVNPVIRALRRNDF